MFKRIMLALTGLFAVLGLVAVPASAASGDTGGAEAAPTDLARAWTSIAYEGAANSITASPVTPGGNPCVAFGATVHSAALVNQPSTVQFFSEPLDGELPCATGLLVATLDAAHPADSGVVTVSPMVQTALGLVGATHYIATP